MDNLSLSAFDDLRAALGPPAPRLEIYAGSLRALDACLGTVPASEPRPSSLLEQVDRAMGQLFGCPVHISDAIGEDTVIVVPQPPAEVERDSAAHAAWRMEHPICVTTVPRA